MRIFANLKGPLRAAIRALDGVTSAMSALKCYGLYDARSLATYRNQHDQIPVVLIIPRMSDREGALIHPGVQILQTVLRNLGIGCEVFNYGLPVSHPSDPFDHLIAVIRTLGVKVLGASLYSQAIEQTMEGLQRVKAACPDVSIVLGGPHPTEAYLSLIGLRFVDFVVRGEAERNFPLLVETILREGPAPSVDIPGVYWYDREADDVHGSSGSFVDLERLDQQGALRYHLSDDEIRQYRLYGGAHGLVGPRYWPLALVRGCPYACTYCAAHELSGRQLRFRRPEVVVDDIAYYVERYGQRHFSFVDDSFTEQYDYVVDFCEEILRRGLKVYWTTDNGIRYESLGSSRRLGQFLAQGRVANIDELLRLMIRAGWRGTSIGLESGARRVRDALVRKGGTRLSNDEILENLLQLKRVAREEGVYFYINAYVMLGFSELVLRNGQVIPGEGDAELQETYALVMRLREAGAIDFAHPSVLIPLPATEQWDHLPIGEKMQILTGRIPAGNSHHRRIREIVTDLLREFDDIPNELPIISGPVGGPGNRVEKVALGTRYSLDAEANFWRRVYRLPEEAQLLILASYDDFNADASFKIALRRQSGRELWQLRERIIEDFYGGSRMKYRLMKHIASRCSNPWEFVSYLACIGRIYMPDAKERRSRASARLDVPTFGPKRNPA